MHRRRSYASCRRLRRKLHPLGVGGAAFAVLAAVAGCQIWPFRDNERTTIITPAMRAESIREMGARAQDAAEAEQTALCQELAQQIRTEPDPIVRRTIQQAVADFDAPLAQAMLLAGLHDEDRDVRTACCRLLAARKDASAVPALSQLVAADADPEVRMAAVDALGAFNTPESIRGLTPAIKDRDPAMQYAGVLAMKRASGEDLGNDVEAWRQYAATVAPPTIDPAEVNVARQDGANGVVQ